MFFGLIWFILRCFEKLRDGDANCGLMLMAAVEMFVELIIFAVWLNGG